MKKNKYFLIILFIIMIIPFISKTLEKNHKSSYKKNNYNINESFYIRNKKHYYDFIISNKKEKYTYTIEENINKRKKVIKEIKKYKSNNITCVLPIYKKRINLNTYCLEDNKQVSNYYLKDNKDYKKIVSKLKKYKIEIPYSNDDNTDYKKIKVYQKNIMDNYAFIIWDYKGIYILKNNELKYQKFLNNDLYENIMSTVNSRYYVLFDNSNVMGIEKIHYYDLINNKYNSFKLEKRISKDSYINGVVDDLIYVTDNSKKIEYALNIKKKKIEVVGKDEEYIKYSNNKKEVLNKSDFFMKKQLFNNELLDNKKISNSPFIKEYNYNYFIDNNRMFNKLNNENNVLLFGLNDIKKWYVYEKDILLISNDELYLYNDKTGLRKIIEYNELKYNDDNLALFWK